MMELRLGVEAGMREGSQSWASVSPGKGGWHIAVRAF